jgi:hypothetical protein
MLAKPGAIGTGMQREFVAIGQERAGFPTGQRDGLAAG